MTLLPHLAFVPQKQPLQIHIFCICIHIYTYIFETGSHYVTKACPELRSCLSLLSAGITSVYHHTQIEINL
jgi:hypothetical protein